MQTFRIATYNIHKARGMDGRTRIDRIAKVLEEINADVVALQEVLSHDSHTEEHHQANYLANRLGYWAAVGEARKHDGGVYGNVTLSRQPFTHVRNIDISVPQREARCVLRADISMGGNSLHLFNAHLGTSFFERRTQARRLLEADILKAVDLTGPRVVAGDFNEWIRGLVTHALGEEFRDTNLSDHLPRTRTYPMALPLLALDHIYFDWHLRVDRAFFHASLRSVIASDHLPLVADFRLR